MPELFAWVHEEGVRRLATGGSVPEGIFYPLRPELTDAEWRAEALAAGATCWRVIGTRPSILVQKSTGVLHALRSQPRGYGKRRRMWEQTTECGMMFRLRTPREDRPTSPLSATTCLSCRKVVRERFENDLRYAADSGSDEGMDAYDALPADDWWRDQAELHRFDPELLDLMKGDRVRHRDYGLGTVIAATDRLVLVSFDVRPYAPRNMDVRHLTIDRPPAEPMWNIPADLNYSLMGG